MYNKYIQTVVILNAQLRVFRILLPYSHPLNTHILVTVPLYSVPIRESVLCALSPLAKYRH